MYDSKRCSIVVIKMTPNRLFPLKIKIVLACLFVKEDGSSWRWHHRYGHFNFKGLKTLQQKQMVIGLPSKTCEECVIGKHQRDTFPRGKVKRAKAVLELIHSNLCGPINPTSNGNKKYFIFFIDDSSKKTWVLFLQEKSYAYQAFKNFKALDENEVGKKIKTLRIDRDGELCSNEFNAYCNEDGIRRQLTASYTP